MARTLLAEIVTPEQVLHTQEVEMVVAMTTDGEIGILPLHVPLVTTLGAGEVRLKTGSSAADWEVFTVNGGYLQVHEDKVIVLADIAVRTSQVDVDATRRTIESLTQRLESLPAEAEDERAECISELHWCELQIKSAEKKR